MVDTWEAKQEDVRESTKDAIHSISHRLPKVQARKKEENMEDNKRTQCAQILAYFQQGGKLTELDALDQFGCERLSARVFDLRQAGIQIKSRWIERTTRNGQKKRYKEYFIPKGEAAQ